MAKLEANLTVTAGQDKDYLCSMSNNYTEVYQEIAKVDNADGFVTLTTLSKTTPTILKGSKLIVIKNNSPVGVELQFIINQFENNSNIDQFTSSGTRYVTQMLGANEYMLLPNQYQLAYTPDASAGNAKTIDNVTGYTVNSTYSYADSGANLAEDVDGTETAIDVDDGDFFRVGDLIQLGTTTGTTATKIEIMRVTGISTNTLTVERGLFGSSTGESSAQTTGHVNGANIYFPFFNTQETYDKYHIAATTRANIQTNASGRYTSQNLFGYGRSGTYPTGIVKGSFAMKFYNNGYQEFGLSGITPNTESGLAASTEYKFNITVDGGSTFSNLTFTTDASNTKYGGNNGVLSKIQSALDVQFYTTGSNLFEKGVTVSIVNGDIRFASTDRTSNSAILLEAPTSGVTMFGVGRLPAAAKIEGPVAAKLPDDTVFDNTNYVETKNEAVFAYDDGKGNITGVATGTINYETGALDFTGPANAEFAVSFNYDSAHSGGLNSTADQQNSIRSISARSMNSKIDAEVEIIGFI